MRHFAPLLFLLTILWGGTRAQTDSSGLRISLLTCSPGSELYSTFGHSALRIVDTAVGTDIVYNFGVFDFSDPDFYTKFVRGKLLYFLDQEAFPYFQYAYLMEGRRITEQVLRLDGARKSSIQAFLAENLRPENRYYKYDFLFDNCTTRLRDLILGQQSSTIRTGRVLDDTTTTFREQLHTYLYRNHQYWSALGIDMLLGSRIDRPMTNEQAMFLPDFLEKALDSSRDAAGSIVSQKAVILERQELPEEDAPAIPPTVLAFSSLLGIIVMLSFNRSKVAAALLKVSDTLLFFVTGALGLLLIFMWTGTDHGSCRDNLNLAWALPTHVIASFRLRSGSRLAQRYLALTAWISAALLAGWLFLPQDLNPALVPVVLWMGWRSYRLSR